MELFLHEITHLLLTFTAGICAFYFTLKNKTIKLQKKLILITAGALLGEFLLDTDHLFDYFLAFGTNFHLDYFFQGKMFEKLQKNYVPFHAWELIIIIGISVYFSKNIYLKIFLSSLFFGILFHLVYDTFYNHYTFLGYSLIYRIIHNFNPKYFTVSGT